MRRKRRTWMIRIAGAAVTAAACVAAAVFFTNPSIMNGEENILNVTVENGYVAIVNGEEVAVAAELEALESAFVEAKSQMRVQLSFDDPEFEIVEKHVASTDMEEEQESLQAKMEQVILSTSLCETYRYHVTAGDFEFSVASKEEAEEILEYVLLAKQPYKARVACVENEGGVLSIYIVTESAYASVKESNSVTEADQLIQVDGKVVRLSFAETVTAEKLPESAVKITPVEEAEILLAGENVKTSVYAIQKGDSLSGIAADFDISLDRLLELNPELTAKTILRVGEEVTVPVPQTGLGIRAVVQYTEEEEIPYETTKKKNDQWLESKSEVVSEGVTGTKLCTYKETLLNGETVDTELLKETVIKEPVNEIVEVGTIESGKYKYPTSGIITSEFGARWGRQHKGLDFGVNVGTKVYASRSGTVIRASVYSGFGNCVEIRHSDGAVTRYAHLSSFNVSVGDTVKQGELIALSGNTGNTTGPHLHFEILIGGVQVNPRNYLSK